MTPVYLYHAHAKLDRNMYESTYFNMTLLLSWRQHRIITIICPWFTDVSAYQPFDGKNALHFFQFLHQSIKFFGISNINHHSANKHTIVGVQ